MVQKVIIFIIYFIGTNKKFILYQIIGRLKKFIINRINGNSNSNISGNNH